MLRSFVPRKALIAHTHTDIAFIHFDGNTQLYSIPISNVYYAVYFYGRMSCINSKDFDNVNSNKTKDWALVQNAASVISKKGVYIDLLIMNFQPWHQAYLKPWPQALAYQT